MVIDSIELGGVQRGIRGVFSARSPALKLCMDKFMWHLLSVRNSRYFCPLFSRDCCYFRGNPTSTFDKRSIVTFLMNGANAYRTCLSPTVRCFKPNLPIDQDSW